jgi:hypothetical protein
MKERWAKIDKNSKEFSDELLLNLEVYKPHILSDIWN